MHPLFMEEPDPGCRLVGSCSIIIMPEHLYCTPKLMVITGWWGCLSIPKLLECVHCKKGKFQWRFVVKHEKEKCLKQWISCGLCGEYKSTIEDVIRTTCHGVHHDWYHVPTNVRSLFPQRTPVSTLTQNTFFKSLTVCLAMLGGKHSLAYHSFSSSCTQQCKETIGKQASIQKDIDHLKEQGFQHSH